MTSSTGGKLLVVNAVKKGSAQKIAINQSGKTTKQTYGQNSITLANGDADTLDLTKTYNSSVTTVNGSKLSAANPVTINVGTQGGTMIGGAGNDKFVLPSSHSAVSIKTSKGNDSVTAFTSNDKIILASGQKITTAERKSATEYVLNVTKSGKSVGTLDVTGNSSAFTIGTSTSANTNTKTKVTTTVTSYYVNVGGLTNITYQTSTATSSTVSTTTTSSRAFTENFTMTSYDETLNNLIEDNNLTQTDDLSEITTSTNLNIDASSLNLNDDSTNDFKVTNTIQLTNNKCQDE